MLLIDIGQAHGLADLEAATIDLLQSHDQAEERGLARTVGAYHADNAVGGQREVEVAEEHLVAEGLRHMLRLDDLVTQARTVGDEDLELLLLLLLLLAEHLLVGVETRLALGLTSLRGHAHPLQLALQRAVIRRFRPAPGNNDEVETRLEQRLLQPVNLADAALDAVPDDGAADLRSDGEAEARRLPAGPPVVEDDGPLNSSFSLVV